MDATRSILIVDDDPATCALYERILGSTYRVIVRSDSAEALTVLQSEPVAVVLLEPNLAYGQGWAMLTDIRSIPSLNAVPVVLCSAVDERRRGLTLGGVAYLLKPFLPSMLLATVQQFI
jgi:twitching motility two-component system response regulator PilG